MVLFKNVAAVEAADLVEMIVDRAVNAGEVLHVMGLLSPTVIKLYTAARVATWLAHAEDRYSSGRTFPSRRSAGAYGANG